MAKRSKPDTRYSREGKYRIGAVARMTGISAHALRAWERRYESLEPARTKAGGRLYSDADVAKFRLIRQLLDRGHSISQIVSMTIDELARTLATHGEVIELTEEPLPVPEQLCQRFLDDVFGFELVRAEALLARAAIALEPRQLVIECVVPILEAICARWDKGELRAVQERAAGSMLRSLLATLTRLYVPAKNPRTLVVATPEGEPHEFGALLLAFIATIHGWRALYLGDRLPASDILEASVRGGANAIMLSVVSEDSGSAAPVLRELLDRKPDRMELMVSGRAGERYRAMLSSAPAATLIRDMTHLEEKLELRDDEPVAKTADKCSM